MRSLQQTRNSIRMPSAKPALILVLLAVLALGGCGGGGTEEMNRLVAASLAPGLGVQQATSLECSAGPEPEFAGTELYTCTVSRSVYGDGAVKATLDTDASQLNYVATFGEERGLEISGEAPLLAEVPAE